MSWLLRLYPAGWRERYETEFLVVLEARPAGPRGWLDVVVGAIDAHLHPELIGAEPRPWTHRLPGLFALGAGLIWSSFFVRALTGDPAQEWGDSIGFAIVLMIVALPGDHLVACRRHIGATVAAIVVAMVLAQALPWSVAEGLLNLIVGVSAGLLVGSGMLTLVAIRAGVGPGLRWLMLGAAILLPAVVAIPVLGGFGPGDSGGAIAMLIAVLPYGVTWAVLGLRMTLRGSPTIVDTPPNPSAAEVSAA
jgi:hypothetical protein